MKPHGATARWDYSGILTNNQEHPEHPVSYVYRGVCKYKYIYIYILSYLDISLYIYIYIYIIYYVCVLYVQYKYIWRQIQI